MILFEFYVIVCLMNDYTKWITDYLARTPNVYGLCKEATAEMQKAFPELQLVPGYVETFWGRRDHFWLKAPDGTILDPTESQFPGGISSYDPWKPGMLTRVGKCMNCGDEIWRNRDSLTYGKVEGSCSDECTNALNEYYNPRNFK